MSIQVQADERVLPTEFGATDADTVEYDEVLAGDATGQDIECEWTEEEVTDQAELFPNESTTTPPTERDDRSVPSPSTVQVEVDVLGALSVVGLARQPRRGKVLELIAWLALHPEGGSPERIAAALWPDATYSGGSFRTYRWDARRALGDDPHGEALLSDYSDLRLSDAVSTDWARFRALAASSDRADKHAALALVRGKALGEADWLWLTMEGIVSSIEAEVSDLATALASEELDRGDFQAALARGRSGPARRALRRAPSPSGDEGSLRRGEPCWGAIGDASTDVTSRGGCGTRRIHARRDVPPLSIAYFRCRAERRSVCRIRPSELATKLRCGCNSRTVERHVGIDLLARR